MQRSYHIDGLLMVAAEIGQKSRLLMSWSATVISRSAAQLVAYPLSGVPVGPDGLQGMAGRTDRLQQPHPLDKNHADSWRHW